MNYGIAYTGNSEEPDTEIVLNLPRPSRSQRWLITTIHAAYDANPVEPKVLTISDGIITSPVPCTAAGPAPMPWWMAYAAGEPLTITLPAGGPGITGYLNIGVRLVPR
jgi:hypothetical protein